VHLLCSRMLASRTIGRNLPRLPSGQELLVNLLSSPAVLSSQIWSGNIPLWSPWLESRWVLPLGTHRICGSSWKVISQMGTCR
jgi:hypothetical protein